MESSVYRNLPKSTGEFRIRELRTVACFLAAIKALVLSLGEDGYHPFAGVLALLSHFFQLMMMVSTAVLSNAVE